jgi:hypothetical protein
VGAFTSGLFTAPMSIRTEVEACGSSCFDAAVGTGFTAEEPGGLTTAGEAAGFVAPVVFAKRWAGAGSSKSLPLLSLSVRSRRLRNRFGIYNS